MEDKIKELLRYSFDDGGAWVEYRFLTSEEQLILSEVDYHNLLIYLEDGRIKDQIR